MTLDGEEKTIRLVGGLGPLRMVEGRDQSGGVVNPLLDVVGSLCVFLDH